MVIFLGCLGITSVSITDFSFIIVNNNIYMAVNSVKKSMTDYVDRGLKKLGITISKPVLAILCIIFGILVILFPNLLVWIVGLFLGNSRNTLADRLPRTQKITTRPMLGIRFR